MLEREEAIGSIKAKGRDRRLYGKRDPFFLIGGKEERELVDVRSLWGDGGKPGVSLWFLFRL